MPSWLGAIKEAAAQTAGVIGVVALGTIMAIKVIAENSSVSAVQAKDLPDVKPEKPGSNDKVYHPAYVVKSTGVLVILPKALNLTEAKAAMYPAVETNFKSNMLPPKCGNIYGMYTYKQAHAKQLALESAFPVIIFGGPEVQASGYYGHYHDSRHVYHIWYGKPINY